MSTSNRNGTRRLPAVALGMGLLAVASVGYADNGRVDCAKGESLARALRSAKAGETIAVRGSCRESVTIAKDDLTLDGGGAAVLDGGGQTVVTVDGARRVMLRGLSVQNGQLGILGKGNASFELRNVVVRQNANSGVRIEGSSSLTLRDVTIENNAFNGLEVDRSSEARVSGTFLSQRNAVFGVVLNNGSSITFTEARATSQNNVLGFQIGAQSSAFVADAASTVVASNNLATGFTVVSGSTLFVFEGAIIAENNQFNHGVSANSNSNIDLDRGGSITARNNGQDGIQLESSLLNLFNMPGLRGSKIEATGNRRHGLSAFVDSKIDLSADASVDSRGNGDAGLFADNGGSIRLIKSNITGNKRDVALSFGARAEINASNTVGSIVCDATVLVRGSVNVTCPRP